MQINALPYILERRGIENSGVNAFTFLDNSISSRRYKRYAKAIYLLFNFGVIDKTDRVDILTSYSEEYKDLVPEPIKGMLEMLPGKKVDDFSLMNIHSNQIELSDYRGKVILLDFWATWCGPCLKEEPALLDLAAKYPTQLVVLSLSLDESDIKWRNHIEKLPKLENVQYIKSELGNEYAISPVILPYGSTQICTYRKKW